MISETAAAIALKLLEYGMKVVERVSEKRLHRIVSVAEMQFEFMPERGTIDSVFILRRLLKATSIPLFLIAHSNTLFGSVKSFPQVQRTYTTFFI